MAVPFCYKSSVSDKENIVKKVGKRIYFAEKEKNSTKNAEKNRKKNVMVDSGRNDFYINYKKSNIMIEIKEIRNQSLVRKGGNTHD